MTIITLLSILPLVCKLEKHSWGLQKKSVCIVEEEHFRLANSYRLLANIHDRLLDTPSAGKFYCLAQRVRDAAYSFFDKDGKARLKSSVDGGRGRGRGRGDQMRCR